MANPPIIADDQARVTRLPAQADGRVMVFLAPGLSQEGNQVDWPESSHNR
jgi:hypothetical protein